jgi:hypothetical protein
LTVAGAYRKIDGMWRLSMFLLCLIAALSGTPLRQAEAADDFARTFGESGQSDVLHTVDGGVGDDKEVSVLKVGGETQSLPATILLATVDVHFSSLIPSSFLPTLGDRGQAALLGVLPASSTRRFAWLQCFLF